MKGHYIDLLGRNRVPGFLQGNVSHIVVGMKRCMPVCVCMYIVCEYMCVYVYVCVCMCVYVCVCVCVSTDLVARVLTPTDSLQFAI